MLLDDRLVGRRAVELVSVLDGHVIHRLIQDDGILSSGDQGPAQDASRRDVEDAGQRGITDFAK